MTTDSFPLRLDTSSGVIKFIETDSDDLVVLAAKVGQYITEKYDSSSRGRWELKGGTGAVGYVGTVTDETWETSTDGVVLDSAGHTVTYTRHVGLINTSNVNQKTDAIEPLVYPLRWDRTLGGLQEMGDSGGSDPAFTHTLDTLIRLIFAHDLPGVYKMAPINAIKDASSTSPVLGTDGDFIILNAAPTAITEGQNYADSTVQRQYLDSDVWATIFEIEEQSVGDDKQTWNRERVKIFQKVATTPGSATHNFIYGKRPTGGLDLIKRRFLEIAGQELFLGVGVMGGNTTTGGSPSQEMQEFFGGSILNRLTENQGTDRPGDMQITSSVTPPAGYRNIGFYEDFRRNVLSNGVEGDGIGITPGSYTGTYTRRFRTRVAIRQGTALPVYPMNARQGQITGRNRQQTVLSYSGTYTATLTSNFSSLNKYYLHVRI